MNDDDKSDLDRFDQRREECLQLFYATCRSADTVNDYRRRSKVFFS
jgi:hypothetical protein